MLTSFDAYVLNATTINNFSQACAQTNLKILSIKSILNTFASNDTDKETIISFDEDNNFHLIQYQHKKINAMINSKKNYDDFITLLASKLGTNQCETENMLNLANLIIKDQTINKDNTVLSTQIGKSFFNIRKITLSFLLEQMKFALFEYLDNDKISLDINQNKITIYGKHQNIFNYLCCFINNHKPADLTNMIGLEKMKQSQQICLVNLNNDLQKDPMDILRTKNIKSSLPFLENIVDSYNIIKG